MKTTKSSIFTIVCVVFLILNASTDVYAQSSKKATLSVETDPSTFMFNGYALHLRFKPANSEHLVLGVGAYAMDMPDLFIGKGNSDEGWNVRINSGFGLFGEYYFGEANSKWFAGVQTSLQNYKNTNDFEPGKVAKYSNVLLMPSVGYNWKPFSGMGLYVKPWLGIGYTHKISGSNELGTHTYKISPVIPFPTVHIGYSF